MDELFDGFGISADQDNFDLAALQYYAELDRQAGDISHDPRPEPRGETVPESRPPLIPDEEVMPDLADAGMDSAILALMSEPVEKKPQPRPATPLTRPVLRKKAQAAKQGPAAPAPAEKPLQAAPLSDLALQAAHLFDSLPTEDQLLAYTVLQKLAKAAEK